jgi:hypothetical protein
MGQNKRDLDIQIAFLHVGHMKSGETSFLSKLAIMNE